MSSTRKEQRKDEEEVSTSTQPTRTNATAYNTSQIQQEQQYSVNRALDETRNNIRRATDEARKDIPRYTQVANEYQQQTIQTAREIADNFLKKRLSTYFSTTICMGSSARKRIWCFLELLDVS